MFEFLRKGATSLFAKIFLAIIIIVFVFWGIGYIDTSDRNLVAEVDGEKINLKEFQEYYNFKFFQLKQAFGEVSSEDLKKMRFKEMALQELIRIKLTQRIAQDLGLKITQEEINLAISQLPFFQQEGRFNPSAYLAFLREMGLTPATFERILKADLLEQKLKGLLIAPILVSQDEVLEFAKFYHQKITLQEFILTMESCQREVKGDEKALESYFNAHRDLYVEEEKIKIAYYIIPFTGEVEVSEEEIKNYYAQNLNRFREPFKVKLRRIVIPGVDANAQKKAQEIKTQIKDLKDFAVFGSKTSEWFEDQALSQELKNILKLAKKGDILGPLKTSQGFIILGVEEVQPERVAKLEEVRDKIVSEIKKVKLRDRAKNHANAIYTKVVAENGLTKWGEKNQIKLEETGYLTQEELAKIFASRETANKIFKQGKGDYFSPLETEKAIYLVEILDKKPRRNLSFEEAKERVKNDYLKEKGRELCEGKVKSFLGKAKGQGNPIQIAQEMGFKEETKEILRKDLPEKLIQRGLPGLIEEPIITEETIKIYYLQRIENSQQTFSLEELHTIRSLLLEKKREEVLNKYLEGYQKRAKIKVYPLFQQI